MASPASHFLPRHTGEDTGGGRLQAQIRPVSGQDDLVPAKVVCEAFPLLYPPPYDGGGGMRRYFAAAFCLARCLRL